MCGVAGLLSPRRSAFGEFRRVMDAELRHRGPDGSAEFSEHDVQLVHCRLSIVDTSPAGQQPFFSADGRFVCVYNGEIYNHEELRSRYHLTDVLPCDGAVIPELFARFGASSFSHLRGMFAICVYDRVERTLWLAVDPLGMKTLYVAGIEGGLAFASEVMSLVHKYPELGVVEVDARQLFEAWGCLPAHSSGLQTVRRLPPGAILEFDANSGSTTDRTIDLSSWAVPSSSWPEVADMFVDSVEHHLMSDVPLGLMLSSGVDSAAIAWAAAAAGKRLDCFTLGLDGAPDEVARASRIARHFGHTHHVLRAEPDVRELVVDYLGAIDRPTADGLNVFLVSRMMTGQGIKVGLVGTGGDEVLVGYPHVAAAMRRSRTVSDRQRRMTRRALRALSLVTPASWGDVESPTRWDRYLSAGHAIARGAVAPDLKSRVRNYRAQHPYADLSTTAFPGPALDQLAGRGDFSMVTEADWSVYLGPMLLADADVFSMSVGLELRLPFIDLPLLARALVAERNGPGKAEFVNATGDALLVECLRERKKGFTVPMGRWLREMNPPAQPSVLPRVAEPGYRRALTTWKSIVWGAWLSRMEGGPTSIPQERAS